MHRKKQDTMSNSLSLKSLRVRCFLFIAFVTALLFQISCRNDIKFNKAGWNKYDEPAFPPPDRSKMLNDLIEHHKLKGLRYQELINLLGEPNVSDSVGMQYDIEIKYGGNIDPEYVKGLYFTFSKDSVITNFQIKEWKTK